MFAPFNAPGHGSGATEFANTGLTIDDTASDNVLYIVPAENLTANRTLSLNVNNANRTLNIAASATISGSLQPSTLGSALLDDTSVGVMYTTLGITTIASALFDDTSNAAMQTTLGVSSFMQTVLDDTSAGAAQTTLGTIPSFLGKALSVNLNSVADTTISVSAAKYIVRKVIVTNASTSLAISIAQLGLYTAAAAGGSAVVTAAANLTGLTGSTKYSDLTISLSADTLTAATLYLRVGVVHGGAATADVYLFGDVLP